MKKYGKTYNTFGEIKILIDGKATSYLAEEGRKLDVLCPHVLGRYHITVQFSPDGKEHTISCVFQPVCSYKKTPERAVSGLNAKAFITTKGLNYPLDLNVRQAI